MKFTQNKKIIGLILVAIVASGCGSQPPKKKNTGSAIKINSFSATPNPTTSNRQTTLSMELVNQGGTNAQDVAARVFGPVFASSGSSTSDTWRNASGGTVDTAYRTKYFGQLRTSQGDQAAIPRRQSWTFTSPDLDANRKVDYDFYGNIFYTYNTTAQADFKIVTRERLREKGLKPSEASLQSSKGPISLDIRGRTPIVGGGSTKPQVCIKVTNTGTGNSFDPGAKVGEEGTRVYKVGEADENIVKLKMEGAGRIDFDPEASGKGPGDWVEVNLRGGRRAYECFKMQGANTGGNAEVNVNAQITAKYGYRKETQTTVTVEGTR